MEGLGSIIADGIEAARLGTESLQVPVVHRAWKGQNVEGVPDLADPVILSAIVQEGDVQRTTPDGKVVKAKALVLLFPPAPGASAPAVSIRDEITLPSGYKGPITAIGDAIVLPSIGPALRSLWLG